LPTSDQIYKNPEIRNRIDSILSAVVDTGGDLKLADDAEMRLTVQKRMKLAGAWWSPENAEHMLAHKVCRSNGEWNSYWNTNYRYAA
jgi:hypothetical protein